MLSHIQNLENRLLSMEALFRDFIEKQSLNERQEHGPTLSTGHQSTPAHAATELNADSGMDNLSMAPMSVVGALQGVDEPSTRSDDDWVHTNGKTRTKTSTDAEKRRTPQNIETMSEVSGIKRRRKEVHVYTDEFGVLETDSIGELR